MIARWLQPRAGPALTTRSPTTNHAHLRPRSIRLGENFKVPIFPRGNNCDTKGTNNRYAVVVPVASKSAATLPTAYPHVQALTSISPPSPTGKGAGGLGLTARQHRRSFLHFEPTSWRVWRIWHIPKVPSHIRHPPPAFKIPYKRSRISSSPRPNGGYGEYGGTMIVSPTHPRSHHDPRSAADRRCRCFPGLGHSRARLPRAEFFTGGRICCTKCHICYNPARALRRLAHFLK